MNRLDELEPLRESTRKDRNLCLLFTLIFNVLLHDGGAQIKGVDILGAAIEIQHRGAFFVVIGMSFCAITLSFTFNLWIDTTFYQMRRLEGKELGGISLDVFGPDLSKRTKSLINGYIRLQWLAATSAYATIAKTLLRFLS